MFQRWSSTLWSSDFKNLSYKEKFDLLCHNSNLSQTNWKLWWRSTHESAMLIVAARSGHHGDLRSSATVGWSWDRRVCCCRAESSETGRGVMCSPLWYFHWLPVKEASFPILPFDASSADSSNTLSLICDHPFPLPQTENGIKHSFDSDQGIFPTCKDGCKSSLLISGKISPDVSHMWLGLPWSIQTSAGSRQSIFLSHNAYR